MALLDKNTFSHAVYVGDSSELDVSEISEAGEFIHHGWTSTGQTAQSIYEMDFDDLIYPTSPCRHVHKCSLHSVSRRFSAQLGDIQLRPVTGPLTIS